MKKLRTFALFLIVILMVSCSNKVNNEQKDRGEKRLEYYSSKIGMWYCVWWESLDSNPKYYDWHWVKETRVKPVKHGYYACSDHEKLKDDFTFFNAIGVDFLILDDTNGHFSDEGNIAANINACFEISNELGSPKLCFAGGGPLLHKNESGMKDELTIFYKYATGNFKENYYYLEDKPLVVFFVGPNNYGFKDDRFTIRLSSGHVSESLLVSDDYNIERNGLWGWVFDMQYDQSQVFGINPGWSRSHNDMTANAEPKSRMNGDRYVSMWLEAIKNNSDTIVIASWNDHAEETGIEAVMLIEPILGREKESENPFYYEKVTEGYLALKKGFLEDWYYRAENDKATYQYKGGKLHKVSIISENEVVIVVPDDYYEWSGVELLKK